MDPITAALNTCTAILALATKVWDATDPAAQKVAADDWAKFTHGVGSFIVKLETAIVKVV